MGVYLNSETAYTLYKNETEKPYFVDKSQMLEELFPLVREGTNYICLTRPRRFGKTVMANMIASFFSRAHNSADIFDSLNISKNKEYETYRNQYAVIHISFNDVIRQCTTYEQYISRVEKRLLRDLKKAYPHAELEQEDSAVDALTDIYAEDQTARFIFVLDEWDFLFHQSFISENEKMSYLAFLSSGSELNMFLEYTMASEEKFSEYFGFTEKEVDQLFDRYQTNTVKERHITRDGLGIWYNGYHTKSDHRLYNPRSVIAALSNNNLGSYWTSSGPYDEIFYYIKNNTAAVREDLVQMISGFSVPAKIREYAATSMNLQTKDEIFSAMVVYGFLSSEKGTVCIPNKELMEQFSEILQKKSSLGYVYRLAKESSRMLKATLTGNTDTMTEILELAHNTETPLLYYNNETELTAIVNLVYLAARDHYRIERQDKAGTGYVDFIFYPETDMAADCIILELKAGRSPEAAIKQIKERKYDLRFRGKLGENPKYTGRILAVGISYDKKHKKHKCKIEILP